MTFSSKYFKVKIICYVIVFFKIIYLLIKQIFIKFMQKTWYCSIYFFKGSIMSFLFYFILISTLKEGFRHADLVRQVILSRKRAWAKDFRKLASVYKEVKILPIFGRIDTSLSSNLLCLISKTGDYFYFENNISYRS